MLHDITAHDEISHAFSHCICRCSVAVFKVVYKSRLGNFYHMRDINVFLGRGGVWRILVPSWWGKSPRPPSKWSQDDGKLKLMACIHFFSRWNCVHKNVLFLLIWTCASSYCHTKLLSFLLDSWRHTWTIKQENCPFLPKSLFNLEDVNTGDWRETALWLNCGAILCKKKQPRTFSDFRVGQGCHLFAIYTALLMNTNP